MPIMSVKKRIGLILPLTAVCCALLGGCAYFLAPAGSGADASSVISPVMSAPVSSGEQFEENTASSEVPPADDTDYASVARQVVDYTNAARKDAGLEPLVWVDALDRPAAVRAEEASRLWSHTRPDGRLWSSVFADFQLDYHGRAENLFSGSVLDARIAVDAWMDSKDHRENIMREDYTHIGIGICEKNGKVFIAQLFARD